MAAIIYLNLCICKFNSTYSPVRKTIFFCVKCFIPNITQINITISEYTTDYLDRWYEYSDCRQARDVALAGC